MIARTLFRLVAAAAFAVVVAASLSAPAWSQNDQDAPRRVALVIGNADYDNASALANPVNDAVDLSAVLTRLGWDVIDGYDLTYGDMQGLVREFARSLDGADDALFFYAGHALQVDGRNHMLPIDAVLEDESSVDFEAIDMNVVITQLGRANASRMIFLDACRDNPLAENLARTLAAQRAAAVGRGLAQIETLSANTLIAYATQPGATAADGSGRNSPFTGALLQHLETPGLEVQQLMRRVRTSVLSETDDLQVPWDNSSLTADFYFVESDAPPPPAEAWVPPQVDPTPRQLEIALWNEVKDTGSIDQIQTYLDAHPDGVYARTARARIVDIEEAETQMAREAADMADAIAARFAELAGGGVLTADPTTAAEFYANARIYEVQGDAVNAAAMYDQYFTFGEPYVDPHLRNQRLLELRQGLARAREVYNGLVADRPDDQVAQYARLLLLDRDDRVRELTAYLEANPDFAPGYYALANQYSFRTLGTQTVANRNDERAALERLLELHDAGAFLRWFLDQELAAEQLEDARARLQAIAAFGGAADEPPVSLMKAGQSDDGFIFNILPREEVLEMFVAVDGAPFESLGHLPGITNPVTGNKIATTQFTAPATGSDVVIQVRYIDAAGESQGPFELVFAVADEALEAAKNGLYIVWPEQWVSLSAVGDQTQVVHAVLQWHACSLERVLIGVESETPDTELPLVECTPDLRPGSDLGNRTLFRTDRQFTWMTVQVTFTDGEESPIKRFAMEVEEDDTDDEIPTMAFPE